MNIGVFSFKDKDVYDGLLDLIESIPEVDKPVILLPIIKPLPEFYNSVIKVAKETHVELKCFFVSADDHDDLLSLAADLVVTDNPVKEVLRNLTSDDEIAIVWDDSSQAHFVVHAVEDLALDIWDISDGLMMFEQENYDFLMDSDQTHEELIASMGKFVDLLATFVAQTVMESLSQAVLEHIMDNLEDSDKKDFNPFRDEE